MYADVGKAIVTCGDAEHLLSRGELIFLPPNQFHNIRADELRPSNVFIISFGVKSDIMPLLAGRVFLLSSEMRRLIRSIVQEGRLAFELPMRDHSLLQERDDGLFGGAADDPNASGGIDDSNCPSGACTNLGGTV